MIFALHIFEKLIEYKIIR